MTEINFNFPISNDFLCIPKIFLKKLDCSNSLLLSILLRKETQLKITNTLPQNKYFTMPEHERFSWSCLSPYKQSKAINFLTKLNLLYPVKRKGAPAKQHFKINHKQLKIFLNE